jgi:phospholipid/cholesterol/gamma-HCH transport system permease protein
VEKSSASVQETREGLVMTRLTRSYMNFVGRQVMRVTMTIRGLGAFALITLGVALTKFSEARRVIHPLIWLQVHRAGVRLMPMVVFVGIALGLVIIGQTVSLLNRVGAVNYIGTVMITVVVRELGPLFAALLVLARIGTGIVIELGTTRATGEVEALEALGIDPIHYLVLPRVIGLAVAVLALTVYLIMTAILSGYLFAFIQDVPITPLDYFRQLADAAQWQDFVLLGLKTASFGMIIAIVTSFQGLAQPLRLEEVALATTNAVVQSLVACILLDALFIVVYLMI